MQRNCVFFKPVNYRVEGPGTALQPFQAGPLFLVLANWDYPVPVGSRCDTIQDSRFNDCHSAFPLIRGMPAMRLAIRFRKQSRCGTEKAQGQPICNFQPHK